MSDELNRTTEILKSLSDGNDEALHELVPRVYKELHRLASNYLNQETSDHTLQSTALVNEAFIKIVKQNDTDWQSRQHFVAVAAQQMRRVLVDYSRSRSRKKRGGDKKHFSLDESLTISPERADDVLDLDEALLKLAEEDPRQATLVELRFFGGMSVQEAADFLNISKRTAESEWTMVRAWLRRELSRDQSS